MADQLQKGRRCSSEVYHDLKLDLADSFRILDLLPGGWNDEIHITLRMATLGSNPKYEALSYTWGKTLEEHTVVVNGVYKFPVTDNLYRALRNLRSSSEIRTLWVDAICINQADVEERNRQVKIMGSIYSTAECVNIWLGEYRPSNTIGLRLAFFIIRTFLYGEDISLKAMKDIIQHNPAAIESAMKDTTPLWHTRAWTIQEFVLAKKSFLCIGSRRILVQADRMSAISRDPYVSHRPHPSIRLAKALIARYGVAQRDSGTDMQSPNQEKLRVSILTAPQVLGHAQASDQRDMIYSLLGLVTEEEESLITIDYNVSCNVVFAKATFASLRTSHSFDIFDYVQMDRTQMPGLPAWAVDFASLPYRNIGQLGPGSNEGYPSRSRKDLLSSLFSPTRLYQEYATPLLRHDAGYSRRVGELNLRVANVTLDPSNSLLSMHAVRCDEIVEASSVSYNDLDEFRSGIYLFPKLDELRCMVGRAICLAKQALVAQGEARATYSYGLKLFEEAVTLGSIDIQQIQPSQAVDRLKWAKLKHLTRIGGEPHHLIRQYFDAWSQSLRRSSGENAAPNLQFLSADPVEIGCMWDYAYEIAEGASFFVTKTGFVGLGPRSIKQGDILVLVRSSLPFIVLRPVGQHYVFRGRVHLHGFMDRSFWDRWTGDGLQEETFVLE